MKRALVSGGAGFIGSHLCRSLLEDEIAVTCVDNLSTGSRANIAALQEHPDFRFVEQDVVTPFAVDEHIHYVYHLASPASVPDYLSRPLDTLRVNGLGTLNLLEMARSHGAAFLFASTSEIYGEPLVHPQTESYWGNVNPNGPRACYDESKRYGEVATLEFVRTYGLDARIVRIFNTYGPHSRPNDGRIIPNFVTQALRREPITIYGDGTQTRSFCYVTDMVAGLRAAMESTGSSGEVFNLGNPQEYRVIDTARMIAEMVGSDAGVVYRPLPVNDPSRRCPDITRARLMLNWHPRVGVHDGLERTIAWFRGALALTAVRR